jgi:long-chain-alcohol oxidase
MAAQEEAKAAATRRRRRGHPLLRGCRRERYTHGLHPAQMEALRAMCGALIPSLPVTAERFHGGGRKDLERFYLASAADGTIPEEVSYELTSAPIESIADDPCVAALWSLYLSFISRIDKSVRMIALRRN